MVPGWGTRARAASGLARVAQMAARSLGTGKVVGPRPTAGSGHAEPYDRGIIVAVRAFPTCTRGRGSGCMGRARIVRLPLASSSPDSSRAERRSRKTRVVVRRHFGALTCFCGLSQDRSLRWKPELRPRRLVDLRPGPLDLPRCKTRVLFAEFGERTCRQLQSKARVVLGAPDRNQGDERA